MTTNLIPFGQDAGLPAYLQNTDYHSSLDDQQVGANVDRISQRDGGIIVEVGGVKSQPSLSIDVVVLDAHPIGRETYRAYYEGTFKEDEVSAPACYSADGKVPSPHAEKPQCSTCQLCPKNAAGSGANGEGKACGYFKHVAVATYPELDRIYRLKVASRSLFSKDIDGVPSPLGGKAWGFTNFAKLLQQMKTPWEAVVTRVSLPKGQTHGFFFTPTGYVTADQFEQIKQLKLKTELADVLTVELSASAETAKPVDGFLPPPPANALPAPKGRADWLADPSLPQNPLLEKKMTTKFSKIPKGTLNKIEKQYGTDSLELQVLTLINETQMPIAVIADVLGMDTEAVTKDLVGSERMADENHRTILYNCLKYTLPIALERKLLPCKDPSVLAEILRVIIEIYQLQTTVRSLQ